MACALHARRQRGLGDLSFAMDVIEYGYLEPIERRQLYQAAMKGMVGALDPYSGYISPDMFEPFQAQLHQEFGGLGIVVEKPEGERRIRIMSALFDSPAFKAGILPGDLLDTVDGTSLIDMKLDQATKLMKGPPGTEVTLSVFREGNDEPLEFRIRRALIETESVTGDRRRKDGRWDFQMQADSKIAYIRVEIFGEKTIAEMRNALKQVRDETEAVIIDLRDNAGGLLPTATELCDMFLDRGLIVSTFGRENRLRSKHEANPGTVIPIDRPLVILVNSQSASASEVTAGCLQDRGRAVVIGERTFGKGVVQSVVEIEGGRAALKLTSAYYLTPSGRRIHRPKDATEEDEWGVFPTPGFEIALDDEQTIAVFRRLRDRGNPLSTTDNDQNGGMDGDQNSSGEKNESENIQDEFQSEAVRRDPSLLKDAQLLRAVEYLEGLFPRTATDDTASHH